MVVNAVLSGFCEETGGFVGGRRSRRRADTIRKPRGSAMIVTVVRLYDSYADACQAVMDLQAAGVPAADTRIVSNNSDNWFSGAGMGSATSGTTGMGSSGAGGTGMGSAATGSTRGTSIPISGGDESRPAGAADMAGAYGGAAGGTGAGTQESGRAAPSSAAGSPAMGGSSPSGGSPSGSSMASGSSTAGAASGSGDAVTEGAGVGAAVGATAGAAAGLLTGLGLLAIPGVGPVAAAGWLVAMLTGAAVGGITGGLIGALTSVGVPEEDAQVYAEGVRRGGTLVTARVPEEDASRIEGVMNQAAVDTHNRGEEYHRSGWTSFDPKAPPYTADQVRTERQTHVH
jgi:hypothetical protein